MNLLHSKDLNEIMHEDIYHAVPSSIIKWLNSFKLTASQRLIMERIISFALQRPNRSDKTLQVRLSLSLIAEYTAIKERTLISALQDLSSKELIVKVNTNQKGTLYQVNIDSSVKGLIKHRFKKPEKQLSKKKSDTEAELPKTVVNDNSEKIKNLKHRLYVVNKEIDEIGDVIPQNFSPMQLLKGNVSFDEAKLQRRAQLTEMAQKLEQQIQSLQGKEKLVNAKENKAPSTNQQTPKHNAKTSPRFIRPNDAKALLSRLRKIHFLTSENQRKQYLKEILWAIRFGWYKRFEGSTFHCINHAIKLLRNNDWRTPAGYKESQIVGFTSYLGLA
jgi:hypothetical protein